MDREKSGCTVTDYIPVIGPDNKESPKSIGFVEGCPGLKCEWTTESQPRASACLRLHDENRCPHTETEKPTLKRKHAQPATQNKHTCTQAENDTISVG